MKNNKKDKSFFRNKLAKFIRNKRLYGYSNRSINYMIKGYCQGWLDLSDKCDEIFGFEKKED